MMIRTRKGGMHRNRSGGRGRAKMHRLLPTVALVLSVGVWSNGSQVGSTSR
eukprot:CAMPEP_0113598128 /NCGR_PEP_ID=MMETSP0015_2-20120614/41398_1 /TAXON_ID=2838 /ORGANISM="Odontella" /LENGTH=50 /DNA_ID=CAMNT_0000506077 /DNA_START=84 /DNA_END=232 /DNA_ORIENTATION=- /assembly_acc=CAM_ASM_000160